MCICGKICAEPWGGRGAMAETEGFEPGPSSPLAFLDFFPIIGYKVNDLIAGLGEFRIALVRNIPL